MKNLNPFVGITHSLAPFFNDSIRIRRPNSKVNCTLKACIFDDGLEDAFLDNSTESTRRILTVHIRKFRDNHTQDPETDYYDLWPYPDTAPQTGDEIMTEDGRKYRIYDTNILDSDLYTIKCRSVK